MQSHAIYSFRGQSEDTVGQCSLSLAFTLEAVCFQCQFWERQWTKVRNSLCIATGDDVCSRLEATLFSTEKIDSAEGNLVAHH